MLGSLFSVLLNIVVPPRRATARLQCNETTLFAVRPVMHELGGISIITLLDYTDPAVRDLLWSLKYERGSEAALICATVLADFLVEEIASIKAFSPHPIVIVPLPLYAGRERERGYNQITRVLNRLEALPPGVTSNRRVLVRTRATQPQTKLSRSERLKNVAGAFEVRYSEQIRNAHIFLVDDITTTGATLKAAAEPLHALGIPITLIALARA